MRQLFSFQVEHGERWYEDIPTGEFYARRDQVVNNLISAGYYASTEYPEVFQKY
jgi:hypothetical protein